jgi:hypothetical protein
MDYIAEVLNLNSAEQWLDVTIADVHPYGVRTLVESNYKYSSIKALMDIYPDTEWAHWGIHDRSGHSTKLYWAKVADIPHEEWLQTKGKTDVMLKP